MQLLIPLSSKNLKKGYQKTLNMLDFRLVQLGKFYSLKSPSGSPVNWIYKTVVLRKDVKCDLGLGIFCLFREGKLGFWSFGDPEWTQIDQGNSCYDDIILHKEQIYVIDETGTVWWVNSETFELIMFSPPLYLGGQKKKLVESEGHLYVVDLYLGERKRVADMIVYKLDEEWGTWVHVQCLGDRLFVLAKDYCFSALAVGLCGSPARNCIFFTDSYDEDRDARGVTGYHTRFFRLDDRRIRVVADFADHICTFSPPPEWLSSQIMKNALDVNSSQYC